MKIYKSIFGLCVAAVSLSSLTGCMEETEPTTVATEKQIQQSSSASDAFLMAMPAYFNHFNATLADDPYGWHAVFGYSAMMYIRDMMTQDMVFGGETGYSVHFNIFARDKYQGDGYLYGQYINNYYYELVLAANNMIGSVNPDNATPEQLGNLGAGLAFRALAYLDMARMYEWLPNDKTTSTNADGNDISGLTVPIVTAEMDQTQATNNPRATHQQMFDFIKNDLDNAEKYIVNLTTRSDNTLPDLACVYGLKARLYMWNEDYANAEKYARLAINNASVAPMTEKDGTNTTTGFNDISKWMWGAKMTSEDAVVKSGIVNWVSWASNQTSFGYTGGGTGMYTMIDRKMYDRMSNTDWRKLEFMAPEGSALEGKNKLISDYDHWNEIPAYVALKFRPAEGNATKTQIGAASAYPIMRVEEMYFIEAEAAAHQDAAKGAKLLTEFMKNYRDPYYSTKKTDKDDVVEEIVFQKRVELWGEGQTFFDIKRLNYSVTRGYPGTNCADELARLNTNGRPAWMNLVLIRTEANNNKALVGKNNPDPSDLYTPWTEK